MVKKRNTKPTADDTLSIHTTFRLPRDLHARLTEASGERGIGEEIRRRLEASFETERDDQTRALTVPASEIVALVGQFFGDWRNDAFAFAVLRASLNLILERSRPSGEPVLEFNLEPEDSLADLFFAKTDTPEQAAKTVAAMALRSLAEKRKT